MTTDCLTAITAWSTLATALAAAVGLAVAWRQLSNLNKSLRITSLTAILELEAEINARKEKVIEIAEQINEFKNRAQPAASYERELSLLENKLAARLENWFNAVDRLAFCIMKAYVPEKDWRAEYKQEIADIIGRNPAFFGPGGRYRNIVDINTKWQRQ